jgi:hypothetical protein
MSAGGGGGTAGRALGRVAALAADARAHDLRSAARRALACLYDCNPVPVCSTHTHTNEHILTNIRHERHMTMSGTSHTRGIPSIPSKRYQNTTDYKSIAASS